jgi:ABC-type phosphate transport system substrate-binding protein
MNFAKLNKTPLLTVFLFQIFSVALLADLHIIVNNSSPRREISNKELKRIYLNRKNRWGYGAAIERVVLKFGHTHKEFCKTILKRPARKFDRFWIKQIFTGKGLAPKSLGSDAEVIDYVQNHANAIGYIEHSPLEGKVKELKIENP